MSQQDRAPEAIAKKQRDIQRQVAVADRFEGGGEQGAMQVGARRYPAPTLCGKLTRWEREPKVHAG
jgi:hypothetical protein